MSVAAFDAEMAAAVVRDRIGDRAPRLALILGSGLGSLADSFEDAVEIPYAEIPGWPDVSVIGHSGVLVGGSVGGVEAFALKGRVHLYEGHPAEYATRAVRVLDRLGVDTLFASNAAGAVNRTFVPGDLMLIAGHIDMILAEPLATVRSLGSGSADIDQACYDPRLGGFVRKAALEEGVPLREGIYAAVLGPSYETPAEIRALERLGADAVGMSTVPEITAARRLGMRCVGVSCITNYAAGITHEPLHHDDVLEVTVLVADRFQRLLARSVHLIGSTE